MAVGSVLVALSATSWSIASSAGRCAGHTSKARPKLARVAEPLMQTLTADDDSQTLPELKEELLDLLAEIPNRGLDASAEDMEDVLEIVAELEELNPCPDWALAPQLGGRWRLRYTSSKTFKNNQGLTGYARDMTGVETPELFMTIRTDYRLLTYEEPLKLQDGSLAAMLGKFAGAESIVAECTWMASSTNGFAVTTSMMNVGGRTWEPADRQDKAIRTMGAGTPAFLDESLFVLRAQLPGVLFIFERV